MTDELLPSWREGSARTALVDFLAQTDEIAPERRVAVFDNDGTLWCEKPNYPQLDFFVWALQQAAGERSELREVPEYDALLRGDMAAVAEFGLERVAMALLRLFEGIDSDAFEAHVNAFFETTRHPESGMRYDEMVYQPMLELLDALEARGFTNCIVTGGGTEFVRAVSQRVYRIPPERVVGTLVTYELDVIDGPPTLLRTTGVQGGINEGAAKIANIHTALGRRPVVAGGNSPGDAEMLEYAGSGDGPCLALVVNHDDAEREYAYESRAGSYVAEESIEATAARRRWTQVSMRNDWSTIYPST